MRILFINAHPDDAEFTCASTKKQAVDLGWEVFELLMTSDEYGTKRWEFKGNRIRMIRKKEMYQAAKVYGTNTDETPKIQLIWFGEIDGYLPFNSATYIKLKKKILEINPDVIISPDSFFSLDLHPDHKHTGWLTYLAVKSIPLPKRPTLLLYHSFNTNFYVKIKDMRIQIKAWEKHRSQSTPLQNKILWQLRKIFYTLRMKKTGLARAEGFRRVKFMNSENLLNKIKYRMIYHCVYKIFSSMDTIWLPPPEELGLIK
ncbi:MAG: PIG-L deacetylase family protein [Promethearchaeota archaeon]